ncbi:VOC family protein [Taibaiella chishuiensis]|uniref:Putative enzyme related to lactoylglutathione lyase n=1 Tax=Taibaiella chishuiensis TaxID=1434707 RepID=A0A2P8D329_9BACT|nr:VOC family protein [Taibaiella chishuiensis]PSK91605.1 putative enzyme related to lactoylglutathione lyase [Taibaiella chishuiensis]
MKKAILLLVLVATSFGLGFAFKTALTPETSPAPAGRVTGIGGIFFTCKNPKQLKAWYKQHLGLNTNAYGATFDWYASPDSTAKAQTQWTPFPEKTSYFAPSDQDFMINYRVDDLDALVKKLRQEGVTIVDTIAAYDYGKFVHVLDGEGHKLELWEPKD